MRAGHDCMKLGQIELIDMHTAYILYHQPSQHMSPAGSMTQTLK